MIRVILQTTEITDSGYKFIISDSNKITEEKILHIFQNSNQQDSSNSQLVLFNNNALLSKTGKQADTGRTSQNTLIVHGININLISETQKEKLSALMSDSFDDVIAKITEEYANNKISSRKIIFISKYISELENKINQLNLQEQENIIEEPIPVSTKKKHRLSACCVIFIATIICCLCSCSAIAKFFKRKDKKAEKSVEQTICEILNISKEDLQTKLLNEPSIVQQLSNIDTKTKLNNSQEDNSWPFIFCLPNESSVIKKFFAINTSNIKAENIIKTRKINKKIGSYISDFYSKLIELNLSDKDFSNKELNLRPTDYEYVKKHLKEYYNNLKKSYLDFPKYKDNENISLPFFTKMDAKISESIKDFFSSDIYGFAFWTNDKIWFESDSLDSIQNNIKGFDYKTILEIKSEIIKSREKSKVINYIDILTNSMSELADLMEEK